MSPNIQGGDIPPIGETKITGHKRPIVCMLVARCAGQVSTIVLQSSDPTIPAYEGDTREISRDVLSKYGLFFTESAWKKFTPHTKGNVIGDIPVPKKTIRPKSRRRKIQKGQKQITSPVEPMINKPGTNIVHITAPEGNTLSEDILTILKNEFREYKIKVNPSHFFLGENNTLRLSQSGQIKIQKLTKKQIGVLRESLGDILNDHGLTFLM